MTAAHRRRRTRIAGTSPLRSSQKNWKKLDFHMAVSYSSSVVKAFEYESEYEFDDDFQGRYD